MRKLLVSGNYYTRVCVFVCVRDEGRNPCETRPSRGGYERRLYYNIIILYHIIILLYTSYQVYIVSMYRNIYICTYPCYDCLDPLSGGSSSNEYRVLYSIVIYISFQTIFYTRHAYYDNYNNNII